MEGTRKRRLSTASGDIRAPKRPAYSKNNRESFQEIYKSLLAKKACDELLSPRKWLTFPSTSSICQELLTSTLKEHFIASDYVMQPPNSKAHLNIQVWAILKNLLALQAGGGSDNGKVVVSGSFANAGEQEDEPSTEESDEFDAGGWHGNIDGMQTVLGDDAASKEATGRPDFVLVRIPDKSLPVKQGLELLAEENGGTPLLVGEVKAAISFDNQIWQPLAFALDLMEMSPAHPNSMWVFLTDTRIWDFVYVERRSCSGTPGGTTPAETVAAGAAVAKSCYSFLRFHTVFTDIEQPTYDYMKLLAILHYIIFPGQKLEDLADLPHSTEQEGADGKDDQIGECAQRELEEVKKRAKEHAEARAKAEAEVRALKVALAEMRALVPKEAEGDRSHGGGS